MIVLYIHFILVGLWGLVNNAGLTTFGEVEWCNVDVYKRIAEVNVFGAINVTKIFLPLIRKAKGKRQYLHHHGVFIQFLECACEHPG